MPRLTRSRYVYTGRSAIVDALRLHCCIALFVTTPLVGQRQSGARSPILEDYYRFERVDHPAISPNGEFVAYVRTEIVEAENRDQSGIWLVSTHDPSHVVRITTPAFNASSPHWSPDGSLLAFSSNRPDGSVWFLRMDHPAGEAFRIPGAQGAPLFSPDGRWMAFTKPTPPRAPETAVDRSDFERKVEERFDGKAYEWMNYRFDRRGYLADPKDPRATPPREIYVVSSQGGEPRQLTNLGVDAEGLSWSADGTTIAFTADLHQRDEYTYERADVFDVGLDGTTHRLTDDGYDYSNPAWSPDGRFIVVQGSAGLDMVLAAGQSHGSPVDLYVIPAIGGAPNNITATWDLMAGAPWWSPDGRYVYTAAGVGGSSHLFRVPIGGSVEQVTSGDRRLDGISFTRDGSRMVFEAGDPTHPGDIFVASIDGSNERRLTRSNEALLSELRLQSTERVLFRSADSTPIEGWVMVPPDYDPGARRYPLILSVHGGPHGAYGNSFSLHDQLLAGQGYVVLFTNPRGSTGYGEAFKWAIWGGWGVLDYQDLMAGVDHVVEHYAIDTDRMGVTGYSYGGFMTNWIIGHTDRFAAAVTGAGISNWVSDYGTADIPRTKESEFSGTPWEQSSRDLMIKLSPITYAGNVVTPTLFVHGESDHRVPITEAEQMYVALKKRKVPARFVRYPESYHGGWTHWRSVHRLYQEIQWWNRWLGDKPGT
jgi:dipeptidyl aminopeptidase/acylaminoacyl peptidase